MSVIVFLVKDFVQVDPQKELVICSIFNIIFFKARTDCPVEMM